MNLFYKLYPEEVEKIKREGEENARKSIALRLNSQGFNISTISSAVNETVETVQSWLDSASEAST